MTAKTKKKEKYSLHHYKNANCNRILNRIRKEYISKGEPDYLAMPYVLMCATTLEARLNDALYDHAFRTWGEKYKTIADAYLSMSFRGKLNSLVPILTNDKYRINQEHFVYQRLASLISVRNLLAHLKPNIEKFKFSPELENEFWPFPYPKPTMEEVEFLDDLTMGATDTFKPVEYHEALEKLESWFFQRCPDRLSKVAMVVACKNT